MTRCFVFVHARACRFAARCGAVAALLLLAAGCALPPDIDQVTRAEGAGTARGAIVPDPVPRLAERKFVTADGTVLPLRVWLPSGPIPGGVKAVILALHGFDDYSNAFAMPAETWAQYGIATYAYDQRGFGAAPGRHEWPGRAPLAADAATAASLLRRMYPGKPIYLLGESMGAAVAIVAMTGESGTPRPDVDGVILTAPAVWGWQTMDLLPRLALWAGVRLMPKERFTGSSLHVLASDNIPMLRALGRDPLVIHETEVDTIYGLVNLMGAALRSAPLLDVPLLVQYGAHDQIVPPLPVRDFVAGLPRHPIYPRRLAYYPHGYHMLLRDLDRAETASDIASWILDRNAPLPSREDAAENDRPWPPRKAGSG
ncbi:MAG TPA: alpha/beta hydrolase [Stellaceae bacterium]|nr:alpha/beta hydrolase [Stellaceae bacterium]